MKASCEHGNELSAFKKYWKILGVAERLTASREGLISMGQLSVGVKLGFSHLGRRCMRTEYWPNLRISL